MLSMSGRQRLWVGAVALLPVLLFAAYLRGDLVAALEGSPANASAKPSSPTAPSLPCAFPGVGPERPRVVFVLVDSLRDSTASDPSIMPWFSSMRSKALHGRMTPCLVQLSMLCLRTMFEGVEPLLASSLTNLSGARVDAPNLFASWKRRGAHIAVVSDKPMVRTYGDSFDRVKTFEDRPDPGVKRDAYARAAVLEWLDAPDVDVIVALILDTDAMAHRVGVRGWRYRETFAKADSFLEEVASRLRPQDTLIVTGDHGHDDQGHHSTGIDIPAAYLAVGPAFEARREVDIDSAGMRFYLGAATCEALPQGYIGRAPFDALRLSGPLRAALEESAPKGPRGRDGGDEGFFAKSVRWVPLLVLMLTCAALLQVASPSRTHVAAALAIGVFALAGFLLPTSVAFGVGALLGVVLLWRAGFRLRGAGWVVLACALVQIVSGALGRISLLQFQEHVKPPWMIGFWVGLVALAILMGLVVRRRTASSFGRATGLAAFALIFFGLFLGPYYYGTARNILFGLTWLLLGTAWTRLPKDRALLRWVIVALVPMLPLHVPLMKEWQIRYFMLEPLNALGLWATVTAVAVAAVLAAAVVPDVRRFRRALIASAVYVVIAAATRVPHATITACGLLILSYGAWSACAVDLGDRWMKAIGQAAYVFMFGFVAMSGYRFGNFNFDFCLGLVDPGVGEATTALIISPLLVLRYLVPFFLLLAAGDRVTTDGLLIFLLKIVAMVVFYIGLDFAGSRATYLFENLIGQELACLAVVFVSLWIARTNALFAHLELSASIRRTRCGSFSKESRSASLPRGRPHSSTCIPISTTRSGGMA